MSCVGVLHPAIINYELEIPEWSVCDLQANTFPYTNLAHSVTVSILSIKVLLTMRAETLSEKDTETIQTKPSCNGNITINIRYYYAIYITIKRSQDTISSKITSHACISLYTHTYIYIIYIYYIYIYNIYI